MRRSKPKKPASAFTEREIDALHDVVRNLYVRRTKVGRLALTFEEYVATFVPAAAREIFVEAAPWVPCNTSYNRWQLMLPDGDGNLFDGLNMTLSMHEQNRVPAPPIPRHLAIQPDAPKEITDRIMHWASYGGDVSRDFGRVNALLDKFNGLGWSRLAIRYYWPTILALCSEGRSFLKEFVPELQDLRVPPKLQPLPPGLQQACRKTAETIASARLIPADIEEPEPGEVMLDIVSGQMYKEDFAEFYGLG